MLGYLQQIWGLSIYFEATSNGMLSMLSWSKNPSWRCKENEGKRHRRMNRWYLDSKVGGIVGRVGTLGETSETLGTVGWTDGPFSSRVGRVAEEEQWR
jgi:hypothetical protein